MTNDSIQLFENEEFGSIRAFQDETGEPVLVASDIAKILGYRDAEKMTRLLDEDEKDTQIVGTSGGNRLMTVITEAGFYRAVLVRRSKYVKDEAARHNVAAFQRWVTHEVLPAIRRDGGYIAAKADETPEQIMARAVLIADQTIKRMSREIEEMKPKALFADAVGASDGTCLVSEFAKMVTQALHEAGYDMTVGQKRMFAWLRDRGYLSKAAGQGWNIPNQRFIEMGIFRIKETAINHPDGHVTVNRTPKITGKGQRYLLDKYMAEVA